MRRLSALSGSLLVSLYMAMPAAHAACDISAPAMLDLYLTGREAAASVRAFIARSASTAGTGNVVELDAAVEQLNAEVWGLYWLSLYSRRLHEVLEQVDAGKELPAHSFSRGTVHGYYTRWDASQLTSSAKMAVRSAASVGTALVQVEKLVGADGVAAFLPAESVKLRQYAARAGNELQACTQ